VSGLRPAWRPKSAPRVEAERRIDEAIEHFEAVQARNEELWGDPEIAFAFLEARGFVVGADFIITRAEVTGPLSTFEASAIDYLVDEWDYAYEGHDED
jgi:hypothetical protein